MAKPDMEKLIRKMIEELMPDLSPYMKMPVKGVVKRVYGSSGEYACDVQPMHNDESKGDEPLLTEVEIPSILGGGGWGLLCLPEIGQRVAVGFYRGDPDEPFVMGMRSKGQATPAVGLNELLIQYSGNVRMEVGGGLVANVAGDADVTAANANITAALTKITGDLEVTGKADITGALTVIAAILSATSLADPTGLMAAIRTLFNTHTHNENGTGGGVTDSPNQQML